MLGWEFPPRISGGLGVACRGLTRALVRNGAHVTFVVPRASEVATSGFEVIGAPRGPSSRFHVIPVASRLAPYAGSGRRTGRPSRGGPVGSGRWASDLGRAIAVPRGPAAGDPYDMDLHAEVADYGRAVREIARGRRFDVVHAHDWMTFPAGRAVAREADVPFVAHVHATEYDRSPHGADPRVVEIERSAMGDADRVVTVSRYAARTLRRRYGVDTGKVRVVYNGIEGPVSRPPTRRASRRTAERRGGPVVLFLGRVTAQKGPQHFLRAAERVARAEPRARFVMAGTGDLLREMVERSARRGLGRRVHFTGFLEGRDLARAYRMSEVFVLPSVSEPFGIAPLEALAHGVPVVLSRRSGVAEVLPSAPRVDPQDAGALADAILDLLRDPAARRRQVADGRRDLAALRWGASARRLLDVYGEALS